MSEPLLLLSSDSIRLDGTRDIGIDTKIKCYLVKVFIDGDEQHYFFNTNSFLLEGHSNSTDMNYTYFSDYRWVDGLLYPFKEISVNSSKHIQISQTIYKSIDLNKAIPDSIFLFPLMACYLQDL